MRCVGSRDGRRARHDRILVAQQYAHGDRGFPPVLTRTWHGCRPLRCMPVISPASPGAAATWIARPRVAEPSPVERLLPSEVFLD